VQAGKITFNSHGTNAHLYRLVMHRALWGRYGQKIANRGAVPVDRRKRSGSPPVAA
jgi:hypothetical protein